MNETTKYRLQRSSDVTMGGSADLKYGSMHHTDMGVVPTVLHGNLD
jgi:hypothetical protein